MCKIEEINLDIKMSHLLTRNYSHKMLIEFANKILMKYIAFLSNNLKMQYKQTLDE